ncbi:MAG TPA: hypothetical protein VHX15_14565 [Frankiaceae bacterium]|nr:hypothetical protein [Frankiaceae bacterium]
MPWLLILKRSVCGQLPSCRARAGVPKRQSGSVTDDEGGVSDPPAAHSGHDLRRGKKGEARLPPAIALAIAIALYALLPGSLLIGPRLLVPGLEVALLIAVIASNPRRLTHETRLSRLMSIALSLCVVLTNLVALGLLVHDLVDKKIEGGGSLLLAALQVWATNVIAFGLIYWQLDRGGPVSRTQLDRADLPLADFRFSHDEDADNVAEVAAGSSIKSDWIPTLIDYLYVSTTNSSAFSPTDTMPLTSRAKVLMGTQATAALLTSLLVIARAVAALS